MKKAWNTRFISDVFLFIAPDGYIDTQDEINNLMRISEEKGAQSAHRFLNAFISLNCKRNRKNKIKCEQRKEFSSTSIFKGLHICLIILNIVKFLKGFIGKIQVVFPDGPLCFAGSNDTSFFSISHCLFPCVMTFFKIIYTLTVYRFLISYYDKIFCIYYDYVKRV